MAKKQKVDPQKEQAKSLSIIDTPGVGESALTSEATGLQNWIKAGDYRERPKNLFFNFADPAEQNKQRNLQMNAGNQGVYALGAASPNLLALNKEHLNNQWAQDTARQYEGDVAQAGIRAAGELGDVAQMENSRKGARLGATTSGYNIDLQKIPWWQQMLNSASAGAASAGTMAAGSDIRLKDNVRPMSDKLDKLAQLNGVLFEWGEKAVTLNYPVGHSEGGVIADEVEKVFPELVVTYPDGFKRVNYVALTGLLVEAVRHLRGQIGETANA